MIKYANESPVITVVPPEYQKDRLDTFFYHPLFRDLDDRITAQTKNLTNIESISEFITDGTHQTPTYVEKENGGVLFLSATNIMEDGLSLEKVKYIPRPLHDSYSNCQPFVDDVMVAKNGKTGVACVFPSGVPECSIYVSIALIRLKAGWLPEFIALVINSELGFLQIQRNQKGIGVKNLHLEDIRQIQIPLIGKDRQKEVLDKFLSVKQIINEVLNMSKALLIKRYGVCVNFDSVLNRIELSATSQLSTPWEWGKSIDENCMFNTVNEKCAIIRQNNERIDARYSLPNRLRKYVSAQPEDWGVLSDYANVDRVTYLSDASLPHVAIDEMPNDPWEAFQANDGYSGSTILLEKGDIAISRLMPTIANGKCFIAWDQMTGSAEFIRVRVEEKHQRILLFWLKSALVREFLLANVRGASASQKRFTEDDLKNCPIPKAIIENPEQYLPECEKALEDAMRYEQESFELQSKADNLLKKAKSNIFHLLDDDWFNKLVSEAKEALQ